MRASCRRDDPGFENLEAVKEMDVYLDGHEIIDVVTADEEQGYAMTYLRDYDGEFVFVTTNGSRQIETIERWGRIEFRNKPAEFQPGEKPCLNLN